MTRTPLHMLILGLPRSGTTALYTAVKAALPPDARCCFEPSPFTPAPQDVRGDVLVKSLVMPLPGAGLPVVHGFSHTVLLLRDPRDRIISSLLFLLHWRGPGYPPLAEHADFAAVMALLQQKEHRPSSVPCWRLFEQIMAMRFGFTGPVALAWVQEQQQVLQAVEASCSSIYRLSYDYLIYRRYGCLESYLGLVLQRGIPLDDAHRSIFRTGSSGAWRHWFTPDDHNYFAPLVDDWIWEYGGATPRPKTRVQRIDPRTSSQYVLKWCRVARRRARAVVS